MRTLACCVLVLCVTAASCISQPRENPGCSSDTDCPAGEGCNSDGSCSPRTTSCTVHADCTADQWCEPTAQTCQSLPHGSCRTDAQCLQPTPHCRASAGAVGTCGECAADTHCAGTCNAQGHCVSGSSSSAGAPSTSASAGTSSSASAATSTSSNCEPTWQQNCINYGGTWDDSTCHCNVPVTSSSSASCAPTPEQTQACQDQGGTVNTATCQCQGANGSGSCSLLEVAVLWLTCPNHRVDMSTCGCAAPVSSSSSQGGTTSTSHAGSSSASHVTASSSGSTASSGTAVSGQGAHLDSSIQITDVALYQAVKVPLSSNGNPVAQRNAAVVANRDALVRVFMSNVQGSVPRTAQCELVVNAGSSTAWRTTFNFTGTSSEAVRDSTCNVRIPAWAMVSGASMAVRMVDDSAPWVDAGTAHASRFPRDGTSINLLVQPTGGPIHLVLVPVRYDTDGSGRLPDTSEAMLDSLRSVFTSMYPADSVDLKVREPMAWNHGLTWRGNVDFDTLNTELAALKESDAASNTSYYYGLIQPDDTFDAYCGGSCVTGQGWVVDDPADGSIRVASGVAFDVDQATWTCIHETGHMHGRYHAPCDASGADGDYPYNGGSTGVWGWDAVLNTVYDPAQTWDFMGYCDPQWISDYTWNGLFERIQTLSSLAPPPPRPGTRRFLHVEADGAWRWGRTVAFRDVPRGHPVTLHSPDGADVEAAVLLPAHGGGLTYLLPDGSPVLVPTPRGGTVRVQP